MTKPSVLLVECPDRPGLVHGITGVLFRLGVNVVGNHEFVDRTLGRFYMRTEFDGAVNGAELLAAVRGVVPEGSEVRLSHLEPKHVVVLASKEHHCLADILVRHLFKELNAHVLAVIANHATLEPLVRKFELPFHHLPHGELPREVHEAEVLTMVLRYRPDFVVLAKYMRVLSPKFVGQFPARLVNIHHSFLPAFVGARPYHQAFERGVKVIGATAHFVTDELDAGPIIVQQVVPVDHTHAAEDLVLAGRDVEQMVLARALRLVFEDRVFLCGNRTVIFD
jgi:formyltetrahydrofolate deformylase